MAHYLNWRNGVQHTDISVNDLMYRRKLDKTPCAVLIDWDLSSVVTEENETCFELMDTVPFKAIDLLSDDALAGKVRHLYRHGLESFIWVFLWVVRCYPNGQKLVPPPCIFKEWSNTDVKACHGAKLWFLYHGYEEVKSTDSWPSVSPFAPALLYNLWAADIEQLAQRRKQWVGELEWREEQDLPDDVWHDLWSVVRKWTQRKPELHYLLDLADLKLE